MTRLVVAGALLLLVSTPACAQHFPFERTTPVSGALALDVSTVRGKIEIVAGPAGTATVRGAATVRIGWDVPSNAVELAKEFARTFTVDRQGSTIRLRPPADA